MNLIKSIYEHAMHPRDLITLDNAKAGLAVVALSDRVITASYNAFKGSQEDRDAKILTRMRESSEEIKNLSPRSCAEDAKKDSEAIHRMELKAQSADVVAKYHSLYSETFGICVKKCPK